LLLPRPLPLEHRGAELRSCSGLDWPEVLEVLSRRRRPHPVADPLDQPNHLEHRDRVRGNRQVLEQVADRIARERGRNHQLGQDDSLRPPLGAPEGWQRGRWSAVWGMGARPPVPAPGAFTAPPGTMKWLSPAQATSGGNSPPRAAGTASPATRLRPVWYPSVVPAPISTARGMTNGHEKCRKAERPAFAGCFFAFSPRAAVDRAGSEGSAA
jgi:hypothetical protein